MALAGTKMKANASTHQAMSSGRRQKTEADLAATGQGGLQKAATLDTREDTEWGLVHRGDRRGVRIRRRGWSEFGRPRPRGKPKRGRG